MTEVRSERRQFLWFLLLALLINCIVFSLFFILELDKGTWLSFPERTDEASVVFEEWEEPIDQIAALKPRASRFGIADEVQDEPEFMPTDVDAEHETNQNNKDDEAIKKILEKLKPKLKESESAQPKLEQPEPEKRIRKKRTQDNIGKSQKAASPIKKLTFADLARGFLDTIKNEGSDWIERAGDENIRPDFREMRYISYIQKIAWHMQNQWRMNRLEINLEYHMFICVRLTLDKEGNLINLVVLENTGNPVLDEHIISGIYQASPYPPIPNHLKQDTITIPFRIQCTFERPRFFLGSG